MSAISNLIFVGINRLFKRIKFYLPYELFLFAAAAKHNNLKP